MTNQERNTILAALRYYADSGQGEPNNRSALIHEIATGGGTAFEDVSLDLDGIERLITHIELDTFEALHGDEEMIDLSKPFLTPTESELGG